MAARAAAALRQIASVSAGADVLGYGCPLDPDPGDEPDDGVGFRAFLISQYKSGAWPAKAVCVTAWHAMRAGAHGVSDLALDPSSTHHAEHLREALGERRNSQWFRAKIPMWNKVREAKEIIDFPMNLPHDRFSQLYLEDPNQFNIGRYSVHRPMLLIL